MRTVRRLSQPLNAAKSAAVEAVAHRFADEKRKQLAYFQTDSNFARYRSWRNRRDELKAASDKPAMPAHLRDCAIKDAFETELKYWAALTVQIRLGVGRCKWTERQKHYCYWLLKEPQSLCGVIRGRAGVSEKIVLSEGERKRVQNYLRRTARRLMGKRPAVKKARSFLLDPSLYRVTETIRGQGISIVSLVRGQRVRVPLKGKGDISGNIRVVQLPETRQIEVHVTFDVGAGEVPSEKIIGLDAGITEVFTDDNGNVYGEELNETLKAGSEQLLRKGKRRNKLHSIAKKCRAKGKHRKAGRIRKFNLGTKRLRERNRRLRATIERVVNKAINDVIRMERPGVIVTEKLDIRGAARSKGLSRRVSLWHRRTLRDRMEFKASAAGCRREQVNPAYTSQTCPECGYPNASNRKGDAFQCLKCGHAGEADRIAAVNLKARYADREITLYTPYREVKGILLERFQAHLESGNASGEKIRTATVSARTSEPVKSE